MTLDPGYDVCPKCGGLGSVAMAHAPPTGPTTRPCTNCDSEGAVTVASYEQWWEQWGEANAKQLTRRAA